MVKNNVWLAMRHFITQEYCNDIYMGQQQYEICNTNIKTNGLLERLEACTIFASPLKRSVQTVEYITDSYTDINFNVVYLEQLMERGLGDFEGKYKESIKNDPNYFMDRKFIVTKTPPNGESISNFRGRVEEAVKIMWDTFQEKDILVISHLQTMRMINFCMKGSFDYTAWHDINYSHGEVVQEGYGEKTE